MTFHAKRRDANEATIVIALRAVGASVLHLDGKGVPDLLVGYEGKTHLLEVKNPNQAGQPGAKRGEKRIKGRGVLTAEQVRAFGAWKGSTIHQVINSDEALVAIGALRSNT